MAFPITATRLSEVLDPSDVKDVLLDFSRRLHDGETIASFTVELSAASEAAGMALLTAEGRAPELVNDDTAIRIWPAIDPEEAASSSFDGVGIVLDAKVTVTTTSSPSRTDQQTFLIQWAQK